MVKGSKRFYKAKQDSHEYPTRNRIIEKDLRSIYLLQLRQRQGNLSPIRRTFRPLHRIAL